MIYIVISYHVLIFDPSLLIQFWSCTSIRSHYLSLFDMGSGPLRVRLYHDTGVYLAKNYLLNSCSTGRAQSLYLQRSTCCQCIFIHWCVQCLANTVLNKSLGQFYFVSVSFQNSSVKNHMLSMFQPSNIVQVIFCIGCGSIRFLRSIPHVIRILSCMKFLAH